MKMFAQAHVRQDFSISVTQCPICSATLVISFLFPRFMFSASLWPWTHSTDTDASSATAKMTGIIQQLKENTGTACLPLTFISLSSCRWTQAKHWLVQEQLRARHSLTDCRGSQPASTWILIPLNSPKPLQGQPVLLHKAGLSSRPANAVWEAHTEQQREDKFCSCANCWSNYKVKYQTKYHKSENEQRILFLSGSCLSQMTFPTKNHLHEPRQMFEQMTKKCQVFYFSICFHPDRMKSPFSWAIEFSPQQTRAGMFWMFGISIPIK